MNDKKNNSNNFEIKSIDDTTNKILLIRKFETSNNITPYDINFSCSPNVTANLTNDEFSYIQKLFQSKKSYPKDINELKKLYISMLKHIFGNFNIINSSQKTNVHNKNTKITTYEFNKELINTLFKLVFVKFHKELDDNLLNLIGIVNPNSKDELEDEKLELYKFKGRN